MKKLLVLCAFLMSINCFSQTSLQIQVPQTIDEYLLTKNVQDIDIIENNRLVRISDEYQITSSTDAVIRINEILNDLNTYCNKVLKSNVSEVIKEIDYSNQKLNFKIDEEWIKNYYTEKNISIKADMLSSIIIKDLDSYRKLNK